MHRHAYTHLVQWGSWFWLSFKWSQEFCGPALSRKPLCSWVDIYLPHKSEPSLLTVFGPNADSKATCTFNIVKLISSFRRYLGPALFEIKTRKTKLSRLLLLQLLLLLLLLLRYNWSSVATIVAKEDRGKRRSSSKSNLKLSIRGSRSWVHPHESSSQSSRYQCWANFAVPLLRCRKQ